ncbi:hypothetical protein H696_00660 [Fonticula alba]|uniref:Ribosomal protein L9 domain-containing protein n=1 Tax=Fonticula alba TaxID=691883 RepID=A0A058ZGM2_FONAL|nr:hypothetical protein H696_00660 [Fonticula alba]KCV73116.1 hypothetical protein H696_00660 [Fonticula alba]|eukprot:XP_009492817.1 hypothetical protein H696_00660 [Fonticula alba]
MFSLIASRTGAATVAAIAARSAANPAFGMAATRAYSAEADKKKKKKKDQIGLVRVQLQSNVRDVGVAGQVVYVAAGYMRNYLLPTRRALYAPRDHHAVGKLRFQELQRKKQLEALSLDPDAVLAGEEGDAPVEEIASGAEDTPIAIEEAPAATVEEVVISEKAPEAASQPATN